MEDTLNNSAAEKDGGWSLNLVSGDLFSCPEDESLAHCISEDCRMGKGIAVPFKAKFGGVDELLGQGKVPGQCAVLKRGRRFVYYLITKQRVQDKPTNDSLRRSLEDMRSHCMENGVTNVSMPRIGCGLDRLKWEDVSGILKEVFQHSGISIAVYSLPEKKSSEQPQQGRRRQFNYRGRG